MKLLAFTRPVTKQVIYIPAEKITGFISAPTSYGNTFIATGADGADGGENGWYVEEDAEQVKAILEAV